MFKVGHIYTHKRMRDVCALVVGTPESYDLHRTLLHVRWFRRDGFDFNAVDSIWIKEKDLGEWYEWSTD